MERIKADNASLVAGAGGDVKAMGLNYGDAYHDYSADNSVYMLFAWPSNTIPTEDEQIDYFFIPFCIPVYSSGECRVGTQRTFYWTTRRSYVFYGEISAVGVYHFGAGGGDLQGFCAVPML